MKKMTTVGVALIAAVILTACGQGSSTAGNTELSTAESTTESTVANSDGKEEASETIFKGTIQENATTGDNDTIRVFLKDVEAVVDEEDMIKSFQHDGVILNVPIAAFNGDVTELTEGRIVEVTLQGLPIMTMSLPPQIPGNSIKQITIIDQ